MEIKKIFLTIYNEKIFLEKMAKDGYVLTKHKGTSYFFEKTEKNVFYRYIFLKNGRKSFLELDYKNRDPNCRLIYGNGFVALFSREDDYPELMSKSELKMNYLKHRQSKFTSAICYVAATCCFVLGARSFRFNWVVAALFALLSVLYVYDVKKTDKLTEEL